MNFLLIICFILLSKSACSGDCCTVDHCSTCSDVTGSEGDCTACDTGYVLKSATSCVAIDCATDKNADDVKDTCCENANLGCGTCDGEDVTKCGSCIEGGDKKYSYDQTKKECVEQTSNIVCSTLEAGEKTGTCCEDDTNHCTECDSTTKTNCVACKKGYVVKTNACVAINCATDKNADDVKDTCCENANLGCGTCDGEDVTKCGSCIEGGDKKYSYDQATKTCKEKANIICADLAESDKADTCCTIANCAKCNIDTETTCDECDEKYTLKGGKCELDCTSIDECSKCKLDNNNVVCEACNTGFDFVSSSNECVKKATDLIDTSSYTPIENPTINDVTVEIPLTNDQTIVDLSSKTFEAITVTGGANKDLFLNLPATTNALSITADNSNLQLKCEEGANLKPQGCSGLEIQGGKTIKIDGQGQKINIAQFQPSSNTVLDSQEDITIEDCPIYGTKEIEGLNTIPVLNKVTIKQGAVLTSKKLALKEINMEKNAQINLEDANNDLTGLTKISFPYNNNNNKPAIVLDKDKTDSFKANLIEITDNIKLTTKPFEIAKIIQKSGLKKLEEEISLEKACDNVKSAVKTTTELTAEKLHCNVEGNTATLTAQEPTSDKPGGDDKPPAGGDDESTTTNDESDKEPTKKKKKLSGGAIAGIVIACVVVVAAIIALLVYFLVIKKKKDATTSTQGDSSIAI